MDKEMRLKLEEGMPEGIYLSAHRGFYCKFCGACSMCRSIAMKHNCKKFKERTKRIACDPGSPIGGYIVQAIKL